MGPAGFGWSTIQSLFPQSGTFQLLGLFFYNLLQTSTYPETGMPQSSCAQPAPGQLWLRKSHSKDSEQTAQAGVAENLQEAPGDEQELWGHSLDM